MFHNFLSNAFIPHGHCYLWKPGLVSLHILSDSLITIAYFVIPFELIYIAKKRKDIPFDWLFMLFASFIILCGITHIMEVWTLWHPHYWVSGAIKAITALVSLTTAFVVVELIPKVLAIPSPQQLREEIIERKKAQEDLNQLMGELEQRIQQRTVQLEEINQKLAEENEERALAEEALRRSQLQLHQQAQELAQALQELKQTQTQLVQTEKMSSLGQMVAGIAHEINNPVNFIYANIQPINEYVDNLLELIEDYQHYYPNPVQDIEDKIESLDLEFITLDIRKILKSIKLGAERIREIVKSLRTFSRLDEAQMKEVELHEGIDSTLMILQHRLKQQPQRSEIKVIKEYGNLPLVECYASQINQVLMNILSNAIDALEERENKIQETSENLNFIPTIFIRTFVNQNQWVEIHIADNGIGMSEEVRQKIYDPFYTTKPVGYGTGLGLAISYQIMKNYHQGVLDCVTKLGKGTEFVLKIPVQRSCNAEEGKGETYPLMLISA